MTSVKKRVPSGIKDRRGLQSVQCSTRSKDECIIYASNKWGSVYNVYGFATSHCRVRMRSMAYSAALQGDVAAGPDRGLEESDCDGPDMSGNGTYDETVLSDEDLAVAVRVIRSLAPEGREISELWRTPRLKPLRSAIVALVDELKSRTKSDHLEVIAQNKAKKREAHAKLQQQRAFDRQAVEKTRM
eukprot:6208974-Pleurochrysis_carterae.AAC.3